MKTKTTEKLKMSARTKAIEYAYPSSKIGGARGTWYVGVYANALATDPVEIVRAISKGHAEMIAATMPEPLDPYRSH